MDKRKKVLIFIDWFLPGYKAGGPIQSVNNLVTHLKHEFDMYIVTSDKDLGETTPYKDIDFNVWLAREGYQVIYLDDAHQTGTFYKELIASQPFEVVYFNSLFSVKFTLLPLWLTRSQPIKKVLAPRGMLGKGALQIKPVKKKVFLNAFKALGLHHKVFWHATSELEQQEVEVQFGEKTHTIVAANLSSKMLTYQRKEKEDNHLNVFFLSRIALKKNLLKALEILAKTDSRYRFTFTIIGPVDEQAYWQSCQAFIKTLPDHVEVAYLGAVPNYKLPAVLNKQHVLLLPTMHENFGHVIMEAWQNACPVIISDQTPWSGLETQQTGKAIALQDEQEFISGLNNFAAMDAAGFNIWAQASYDFAKSFTENPKNISDTRLIFK